MNKTTSTSAEIFSMDDFAKALDAEAVSFEKDQLVRGKIHSYDSDGVYVDINGKSLAFVPAEEVAADESADLSALLPIGDEQEFLIIREQNADGQVTLSKRQLQVRYAWNQVGDIQSNKESIQLKVTGVNKGGVTVNFQGIRGFIPRSQLLERDHQSLVGTSIPGIIIEADKEKNKLVFSQRQATRTANFSQLELGQLVTGTIVGIKPFGAFVEFDGNTGLIYIKQVSQNRIEACEKLFTIGQEIKAMIIDLDEGNGKISLSTRVLENHPGEMLENMAEVMASAEARSERAAKKLFGN
ncbi:S1 RNA-binding domain-containing protein [Chamaesiphon sp. VAR_69_metabat_338]|uniref:S1 RNA-binding domain-containing protein n=1 Tax=Chamaesiphon sp. VAR_69_metabat_338 TaxID=2964704 RepID=UPI00286DA357|nr:S1 RNA-binding domain-containing protein [Chamaesiphon sp. VAR_69_metabat_338]